MNLGTEEKAERQSPLLAIEPDLNTLEKVVENYFHPEKIAQTLDPAESTFREDVIPQGYLVYDIFEDDNHYILEADLPGRNAEEINVSIANHILKITAERKVRQKKLGKYIYSEKY